MNQLFETQLQVVQRALGDVVAPALANAEPYVVEQLQLSIATLAFMQQNLPYARQYYRSTLLGYVAMAEGIATLLANFDGESGDLDALIGKGKAHLDCALSDLNEYRDITGQLRVCIAALATAAQGTEYEAALDTLILEFGAPILLQDRIWCVPMGFELRPEELPLPDWGR